MDVEEMLDQLGMYSRAVKDIAISVAEAANDVPPHTWNMVELYADEVRNLAYALSERVREHRGDCPRRPLVDKAGNSLAPRGDNLSRSADRREVSP